MCRVIQRRLASQARLPFSATRHTLSRRGGRTPHSAKSLPALLFRYVNSLNHRGVIGIVRRRRRLLLHQTPVIRAVEGIRIMANMTATTKVTTITDPDSTRFKNENNISVSFGGFPLDWMCHANGYGHRAAARTFFGRYPSHGAGPCQRSSHCEPDSKLPHSLFFDGWPDYRPQDCRCQ